jgi:hypothetical protein
VLAPASLRELVARSGLEETQEQLGEVLRTISELGRVRASQQGLDLHAARREAERLHEEGIGFGTIRHELGPFVAEELDAERKEEESPAE